MLTSVSSPETVSEGVVAAHNICKVVTLMTLPQIFFLIEVFEYIFEYILSLITFHCCFRPSTKQSFVESNLEQKFRGTVAYTF